MTYTVHPLTAITGRVKEFIADVNDNVPREKRVYPASCTIFLYENKLYECLKFVSRALRKGAGVKVHLERFRDQGKKNLPDWHFMYDSDRQDFDKIAGLPPAIRDRYLSNEGFEEHYKDNFVETPYRVIRVGDSMQERTGELDLSIEESWLMFIEHTLKGYVCIVDLSRLRPAGTESSNRLIATGAFGLAKDDALNTAGEEEAGSFVSIYHRIYEFLANGDLISLMQILGQMNQTIRQGRYRKTGIVCTGLHYQHPDIKRYLAFPLEKLVGSQKKAVRLDAGILADEYKGLKTLILNKVNTESVFLEKVNADPSLYSNVCVEILQKPRATCLISHCNGGKINSPIDIVTALEETTRFACELWKTWRNQVTEDVYSLFLPLYDDKQVGVGWIGWANYLAHAGVKYREFNTALGELLDIIEQTKKLALERLQNIGGDPNIYESAERQVDDNLTIWLNTNNSMAKEIVIALYVGYQKAARIARGYGLDRVFTMAPTQTCAYAYEDLKQNTTCRSIDPPFVRRERRNSMRSAKSTWHYFGNVELAQELGPEEHFTLWQNWQRLMNTTGLAHTMSFDNWETVDDQWFDKWLSSSLQTTYYNFAAQFDSDYLNKGRIAIAASDNLPLQNCGLSAEMACDCAE